MNKLPVFDVPKRDGVPCGIGVVAMALRGERLDLRDLPSAPSAPSAPRPR